MRSKGTLLRHPNFGKKSLKIHQDATKAQLGAVIAQEGKPIVFYSTGKKMRFSH